MKLKHLFLTLVFLLSFLSSGFAQEPTLLQHGGGVRTVEFSPVDVSLVASAGESNVIKLWNLRNNTAITLPGHTGTVNSIAFSPDGQMLASVSDDRTIKLWNVHNHQNIRTLQDGVSYRSVAFSPDGQVLATGGDKHVKLWDTRRWTAIATLRHNQSVRAVTFSHDGQLLAAGDGSREGPGTVTVWDVERQRVVVSLDANPKDVKAVEFSSDNRYLAGSGWNGHLKIWDVRNWELLGTIPNIGHYDIAFSPDGKVLVGTNGGVAFWLVETGENVTSLPAPEGWRHPLDFSADGTNLAVSGDDGVVRIYNNVDSFQETQQEQGMVRVVYFLPNDRRPQPDINVKLDALIKDAQQFYADEMERHGFGRKTFQVETDRNGKVLVHHVRGKYNDIYYQKETTRRVNEETKERFDQSKSIYLFAVDVSTEVLGLEGAGETACGQGGDRGAGGGHATLPASGHCFNILLTAHEFGHAFGLQHDFRDDTYIMSYGKDQNKISKCAAEWLDVHPYFNLSQSQTSFYKMTKIQMHSPLAAPPNAIRLRFQIDDADGVRQVQLLTPATSENQAPGSPKLLDYKRLDSKSSTVEFIATELTAEDSNEVRLQVIDMYGNFISETYPIRASDTGRRHTNRIRTIDVPGRVPETLQKISGDNQRGTPNTRLANPFVVVVRDVNDEPIAGVQVTFRVKIGKGRLSVTNPWTDSNGRAQTFLTLGRSLVNSVEASVSGVSDRVTFSTYSEPQVLIAQSQRPPMYWIDTRAGTIYRLVGTKVETFLPRVRNTTSLAIDMMDEKLYWAERTGNRTGRIRRANLDGTNVQLVKDLTSVPHGITIDTVNDKLYWTNSWGKIQCLNFDGSKFEPNLITDLDNPDHLTLDMAGGKLYWTEASGQIRWANLNGSNVETLAADLGALGGIAIANGKLYWTEQIDENTGKVQRVNLDGTSVQTLASLQSVPIGITVDTTSRKLYWTDSQGKIRRANLNGKNIQNVVTGLGQPSGIILGIASDPITVAAAPVAVGFPDETELLANYPNPFNPETWIPYQLSEPTEVRLTIYAVNGTLIRTLALGYQSAGIHHNKSRAAYWDGRNEQGERVASGVYFYTLSTGNFTSTRRMLIRK